MWVGSENGDPEPRKASHLPGLEALAGAVCGGPDRAPLGRGAHITLQLGVLPGGSAWRSRLFGSDKSHGTGSGNSWS